MTAWDWVKSKMQKKPDQPKEAILFNPSKNHNFNPLQQEKYLRNPNANPNINPSAYEDQDNDGISDNLELPVHKQKLPRLPTRQDKLFQMHKAYKEDGTYVQTVSYPLPPVAFEKKMFDRNKRIRNRENKFMR